MASEGDGSNPTALVSSIPHPPRNFSIPLDLDTHACMHKAENITFECDEYILLLLLLLDFSLLPEETVITSTQLHISVHSQI